MATITVFTYRCPKCRADIGRRFGLITTPMIVCGSCGTNVRIDKNVIQQNWAFNFGWAGGLFTWLCLAVAVINSPAFATKMANNTLPAATFENRLVIAAMCGLWAMFVGMGFALIGGIIGTIVAATSSAWSLNSGGFQSFPTPPTPGGTSAPPGGFQFMPPGRGQQPAQPPAYGAAPAQPGPASFPNYQGYPSAAYPQAPAQRGCLIRAFFILLWPPAAFLVIALTMSAVARSGVQFEPPPPAAASASTVGLLAAPLGQGPLLAASALVPEDVQENELKYEASQQMATKMAPWILLTVLAVFILGCIGWLPFTGRKLRTRK